MLGMSRLLLVQGREVLLDPVRCFASGLLVEVHCYGVDSASLQDHGWDQHTVVRLCTRWDRSSRDGSGGDMYLSSHGADSGLINGEAIVCLGGWVRNIYTVYASTVARVIDHFSLIVWSQIQDEGWWRNWWVCHCGF